MAEDTIIRFFIKPRSMNITWVKPVISACILNDSKYAEDIGFNINILKDYKKHKGNLNDAIKTISKSSDGGITFYNDSLYWYNLSIHPQKGANRIFGYVRISTYGGGLEREDTGQNNARQLINIAKSIWNSLDEKPVYGYADDTYSIPAEIGPHPNDDDILALNVPINKFWLNFYGKKMIEKFGRKKLGDGAYKVEELDDGLLVITDVVPSAYKGGWGKTPEQRKAEVAGFMKGVEEYLKKSKK